MLGYIIAFILGCVFQRLLPDLRHRFFAWFINRFNEQMSPQMKAFKKEALQDVKDVRGREGKEPRLLEVGVGTGTNFQHYPPCHLTVVDPNPHFRTYYDANRAQFPSIKSEEIIVGFGEDMDMVASGSVDAVVMTLVLCSVKDTERVLEQVHRVLVPGGKFFFLEHIREWDDSRKVKQTLQDVLTVTGVWPGLCDGCCLNRETHQKIDAAGFSSVKYEKKYAPLNHPIFDIVNPMVMGVACK